MSRINRWQSKQKWQQMMNTRTEDRESLQRYSEEENYKYINKKCGENILAHFHSVATVILYRKFWIFITAEWKPIYRFSEARVHFQRGSDTPVKPVPICRRLNSEKALRKVIHVVDPIQSFSQNPTFD